MSSSENQFFSAGLKELHLVLNDDAQQKLLYFLEFLKKWNNHYNLTAITDIPTMITRHLLDSLSIAPFMTGQRILDLGSGAGFPGIPLAVYFPQKQFVLLDSNGKKTRFLIQALAELQLSNVTVVNARAECWGTSQRFDIIVTRAVGSMQTIISQSRPLLQPGGQWIFVKGHFLHEPLSDLPHPAVIHSLRIPGIPEPRSLIIVNSQD